MANQAINENENEAEEVPRSPSLWWWQPDPNSPVTQALKRTRLDGLKEALKPDIHVLKRIFWILVTLALIIYGVYLCKGAIEDFMDHNIRYDKYEATRLADAPWPSAILCPRFMLSRSKFEKFRTLKYWTEDENVTKYNGVEWTKKDVQILNTFVDLACDAGDSFLRKGGVEINDYFPFLDSEELIKISDDPHNEVIKEKIVPFFQEGLVNCEHLVKFCSWNGEVSKNCSGILRHVQTDVGTCCGFNTIPDEILTRKPGLRSLMNYGTNRSKEEDAQWAKYNLDNDPFLFPVPGRTTDPILNIPKRQKASGRDFGLSLVIGVHDHEDEAICPIADGEGMLMAIVDPMDEPQMLKKGFYLKPNHETFVQITSKFTKASESMHGMKVDVRKCYFSNETVLKHYAKYTESNCQLECQAEVIEDHCKCIPIDLSYGNNSIICGPEKKECINEAKLKLIGAGYEKLTTCKSKKCYRSCNQIEYTGSLSNSPLPNRAIEDAKKIFDFSPEVNLFVVHAFQVDDSIPTEIGAEHFSYTALILLIFGIMGFTSGMTGLTPFRLLHAVGYYILCKLKTYSWFQKCYNLFCVRPVQRENEPATEVESVNDEDIQGENVAGENENGDAPNSDNQSDEGSGSTELNVSNSDGKEGTKENADADSGVPSSDGQNEDKDEKEGTGVGSEDEENGDGESSDAVPKEQKDDESKEPDSVAPFSDQNENEEADDKSIDEVALDGDEIEGGAEDTISIFPDSDDQKKTPVEDENAVVPFVPEDNAESENDAERDPKNTTWADIQNQDGYVERKFKHVTLDLSPESQRRLQLFIKTDSDSYSILVGPNPKSPTPKPSPPCSPSHPQCKENLSLVISPSPSDSKDEKPAIDENNTIRQITVMPKDDPNPTPEENDQSQNNNPSSEIKTLTSNPEEIPGPSFHVSRLGPKMNRPSNSFSRHVTKDDMELTEVVIEPRFKRPSTAPSSFEVHVPNLSSQVQPMPDVEEVEDDGPWTAERILKLWKS